MNAPLTPVRTAAALALAAAACLGAQWLRPPTVAATHPDPRVWLDPAAWRALGLRPWQTVQWHTPRWQPPAAVSPALPDVPPAPPAPVQATSSVAERPLFSPNRRPVPPPPPPPPPKPPDALEGAAVLGIVGGPRPVVLLRLGSGAVQRVTPGARVGEWTLQQVEPEAAVFVSAEHRRRYPVAASKLSGTAPPPPVAPEQIPLAPPAAAPAASGEPAADPASSALQRAQQQIEHNQRQRANRARRPTTPQNP